MHSMASLTEATDLSLFQSSDLALSLAEFQTNTALGKEVTLRVNMQTRYQEGIAFLDEENAEIWEKITFLVRLYPPSKYRDKKIEEILTAFADYVERS